MYSSDRTHKTNHSIFHFCHILGRDLVNPVAPFNERRLSFGQIKSHSPTPLGFYRRLRVALLVIGDRFSFLCFSARSNQAYHHASKPEGDNRVPPYPLWVNPHVRPGWRHPQRKIERKRLCLLQLPWNTRLRIL
eukprot:g43598.t1